MKITTSLKQLAILILALGVAVGCASTKSKKDTTAAETPPAAMDTADKNSNGSGSYTVVSGDNLWNIASSSSIYGDPYKWPLIYKANKSKISDADLIYPGQNFDIDQSPSSGDVSAAVNHAKTRGAWSVGAVEASDTAYLSR
ncbi:MAG TPA: LysM peptidoglycan-binding domain-containing protein [Gammaproteobacteria bacterium]|nr:LysM peptidoglycan-binding domain-containing protein [Gammaproteobacteria bacterium]